MKDVDLVRNIFVHLYWQADDHRVYLIIQSEVGNLDTFRQQILVWLDVS